MLYNQYLKIFSCILFLLVFYPPFIYAQKIIVLDQNSNKAIENVTVYDEKGNSILTDKNGSADISKFTTSDFLYFQHPAYHQNVYSYNEVKNKDYLILLIEKVINIQGVVVSANKWEQDKTEVPNQIVSISPKAIISENPQTTADLIEKSGQVFVQKSQLGGGSPMIRGFAANSVLIVVDGVRMNNAIFRSGNLQNIISLDPNILDGAEIIFGPGSVIYGSDAMGGVMDFHTRSIHFSDIEKPNTTGSAFLRYSMANKEKTGHFDISIAGKKIGALTSITFSDFDDLKTGSQRTSRFPEFGTRPGYVENTGGEDVIIENTDKDLQVPSGYNQLNILQKFRYKPLRSVDLSYTFNYSITSDIPRYDRLIEYKEGLPVSAEWYYGPQKWMMNTLKASLLNTHSMFDQAKITLAVQNIEESRNSRNFQDPQLKMRTEKVAVYSLNADFDKVVNEKDHLFYGFETLYNDVSSSAFKKNIYDQSISSLSTRYPNGGSQYISHAAYLNYKRKISSRFILNSGIRYSFVKLSASLEDTDELNFEFDRLDIRNGALNGSLGLVYKPKEKWQLNFVASTGFRAPNVDDIGKVFSGANNVVTVPNPDLKPEYSYNTEFSISKVIDDKLKVNATAFYSWLTNAMVRRDFTFNSQDSIIYDGNLSKVTALVNTGRSEIYGGSLNILAEFNEQFALSSSVNITHGKDKVNDEPLRHTTPLFGQTSLTFKKNKLKSTFLVKYNGKRSFNELAPSERDKPHLYTPDGSLAWYTLNLKISYQLNKLLQINGGIDNIMDKHYRPYSSGISAPGRNLFLTLRAGF